MIQAGDYYAAQSMRRTLVDDCSGLLGIKDINNNARADYVLDHVPEGKYTVQIRLQAFKPGTIEFRINDQPAATIPIPQELATAQWITLEESLVLPSDNKTLSLHLGAGSGETTHINWLKLMMVTGNKQPGLDNRQSFSLFPNPCRTDLHILSAEEIHHIDILDYAGRVVYHRSINERNITVPVTMLNTGVYFVRIQFKNRIAYSRFIKID